jgi:hypothetical protein
MPKAIDLRLNMSFTDAVRQLANTPPPPESKAAKKAAAKQPKRAKR